MQEPFFYSFPSFLSSLSSLALPRVLIRSDRLATVQASTAATDEQQHTTAIPSTASWRARAHSRPVWNASRPSLRTLGAQSDTLARQGVLSILR